MNDIKSYLGVALIVMGALALLATRLKALSGSNVMLLTGLLLIVAGIVVHVRGVKSER